MDRLTCPACGATVLADTRLFEADLPCPAYGLTVSVCENCGKGYAAAATGIDGHCIACSEEVWLGRS